MDKRKQEILDLVKEIYNEQGFTAEVQAAADKILKSKDPRWNYLFACNIKGADIKAHGQVVIDSKDPRWNYDFACNIKGADVKAHGQVVIDSKAPEWNYYFACDIEGADVKAHEKIYNPQKTKIEKLNELLTEIDIEQ